MPDAQLPYLELQLDEANELLSAWACAQASNHGTRALLIKGRALADDGLRAPRTSADVDLLVEPDRFDDYCAAVLAAGWEEFPPTFASSHFILHSRSFRKVGWPNSFDVHSEYPGFLRGPSNAFNALWESRRMLTFAHRDCPAPSRAANALILALHSLRGAREQPRHQDELAHVSAITFTDTERDELAELAAATEASLPLRKVLAGWGVDVEPDAALSGSAAAREWQRKTTETEGLVVSWILLLARAPWRSKPGIVLRALWPSRADLVVSHPEFPDRLWQQVWCRIARWGRGLRRLPAALSAFLRR